MSARISRGLGVLAVALSVASASHAITHTWNGGNSFGPDSMSNGLNWSGGVPVSGSSNLTLVFPAFPSSNTPNQNIATPLSLQALSVSTNGFYSFTGNTYRFDNLGANPTINIAASTSVNFNANVTFNAPTTITNAAPSNWTGIFGGNAPVTLNATQQMNVGGAGPSSYTGTFTVSSGVLVLQRNGTFTNGDIHANGGSIQCMNSNQFGPNTDFTANGGALILFSGNQTLRDATLNSGSFISFAGNNTLFLTGNVAANGSASSIGNNNFDTLNLSGNNTIFNVNTPGLANALTINASIVNGTIQKGGAGVLNTFSSSNSFTGTTIVTAGTLRGTPSSIGSNVLNNANVTLAGSGTFNSNVITGIGSVTLEGGVGIALNAAQGYTGGTDIQNGSIIDASAATLSGNYTSTTPGNGGVVQITQTTAATLSATFSGAVGIRKYGGATLTIGGVNTHTGTTEIYAGGINVLSDTALGTGAIQFGFGPGAALIATGTRTIANPLILGVGNLVFNGSGDFDFTDTTAKNLNAGTLVHVSTGTTKIAGKFAATASGAINVSAGNLVLGDAGVVGGFVSAGPIAISGGTLTLKSLNFISLPDVSLSGGTLNAPNGYAIPLGAALQGNGGVTGRVASANGSTILANGNLTIGDASHPAGVNLDGELYTGANTVNLLDSNQAVLGSLTRIGTASANGTLVSNNGAVVNFGRNITGRGQVQSTNTLARAIIMNGDATGDSFVDYLEFTGYVKGVGTFNNVAFSGTFAPGLSPALVTVGNAILTPSNVLEIELGGLNRGSQYDAIDITGTMALSGQLKLTLINSFVPALGNQFNIFDGATVGTFSSFFFPPLTVGLVWDTSLLYTQGIVQVVAVPEPASLGAIAALTLVSRRRRR